MAYQLNTAAEQAMWFQIKSEGVNSLWPAVKTWLK